MKATKPLFTPDVARAQAFAEACPRYAPTSMRTMEHEGTAILLKNESERFGLGAFKALGGVYAVGQLIAEAFTSVYKRIPEIDEFMSDEFKALAASQSFVCASAGNHGVAVAAGARLFGSKARIYLSEEVPDDFAGRLCALGAEVVIAGANYEASLVAAQNDARDTGSTLLADGCFPEREHPPALVMEGYTVMGTELGNYFKKQGVWPSDVYLQAGVGGMAAAVSYMIRQSWPIDIRIVIVEPEAAVCLGQSALAGKAVEVSGPVSSMGRLDCKAPSVIAFDTLERSNVEYAAISDAQAQAAVELLAQHNLATTPSGAAGLAAWLKEKALGKNRGNSPLIVMTEQGID